MPRYAVPFEVYGVIELDADTPDEAMEKAHDGLKVNRIDDDEWDYWQIDGSTCRTPEEM